MQNKFRKRNRGAVIVELAVCLPVLVMMVWGTVEVSGSIFLKQTLTSAAHEGALHGMRHNALEQGVIDRVNLILSARNVTGCNVQILTSGPSFDYLLPGEMFWVQIKKNHTSQFSSLTQVTVTVASQRQ